MNAKETIENLKGYQMKLAIQSSPHATLQWDDRHGLHKSLEDAISLMESMGKDGEMLDKLEEWGSGKKWVARESTRDEGFRLHNISGEKWRDHESFDTAREAIADAMKKEAQA